MDNKNNLKLAKRYASSLMQAMLSEGQNSDTVIRGLDDIKSILLSSDELYSVMLNPVISAFDKENIVDAVFKNDSSETMRNLLKLLVKKNRFNLIYEIIEEFKKLIYKIKNIIKVDITSAIELEQTRKNEIQSKLISKLNKQVEINYTVDNSVIAGLVFKTDDNVLDTSFVRKLEDLKQELI